MYISKREIIKGLDLVPIESGTYRKSASCREAKNSVGTRAICDGETCGGSRAGNGSINYLGLLETS